MAIEMPVDKITLDLEDSPELQTYFARKEAGEECTGKFEATIDETGNRVVLSITEIVMDAYKEGKKASKKASVSVAEQMMEGKVEGEESGEAATS